VGKNHFLTGDNRQNLPFRFKVLANLPHLVLGGFAVCAGFALAPQQETTA